MKTEHTPGPWKVYKERDNENIHLRIVDSHDMEMCMVIRPSETGKANARLIAAAPEMLEALEELRDNEDNLPNSEVMKVVHAAIAKAEGRES